MWPGLEHAKEFLLGAILMGDVIAGLFFVRYWKVTGDRLFLFFAWSFVFGALSRVMLAGHVVTSEAEPFLYVLRLLSYLIILAGIADKNRSSIRKFGKMLFQRA